MKVRHKSYRLPSSKRRVHNALNHIITNNYESIVSPRLENDQFKVKQVLGFTKPKPEQKLRPEVEVVNPATGERITILGSPGGLSVNDTPIFTVTGSPDPPSGSGPGYRRKAACIIGLVVNVSSGGTISSSAQSGDTTNSLDLKSLLVSSGKAPTTEGTYTFTFEFFGWYRKANLSYGPAWISADDNYKIFDSFVDAYYIID
tara:strand:+ start:830 stop:1435 length:606 start_codon:yes stop_codon:yes gene_type:complete